MKWSCGIVTCVVGHTGSCSHGDTGSQIRHATLTQLHQHVAGRIINTSGISNNFAAPLLRRTLPSGHRGTLLRRTPLHHPPRAVLASNRPTRPAAERLRSPGVYERRQPDSQCPRLLSRADGDVCLYVPVVYSFSHKLSCWIVFRLV